MNYSNKDFLIAKQFKMKEEVNFKMGLLLTKKKDNVDFASLALQVAPVSYYTLGSQNNNFCFHGFHF